MAARISAAKPHASYFRLQAKPRMPQALMKMAPPIQDANQQLKNIWKYDKWTQEDKWTHTPPAAPASALHEAIRVDFPIVAKASGSGGYGVNY